MGRGLWWAGRAVARGLEGGEVESPADVWECEVQAGGPAGARSPVGASLAPAGSGEGSRVSALRCAHCALVLTPGAARLFRVQLCVLGSSPTRRPVSYPWGPVPGFLEVVSTRCSRDLGLSGPPECGHWEAPSPLPGEPQMGGLACGPPQSGEFPVPNVEKWREHGCRAVS